MDVDSILARMYTPGKGGAVRERVRTAYDFMMNEIPNQWDDKVISKLRAIDFSHPVHVEELAVGEVLMAFQEPGARMGRYYTRSGSSARDLGIVDEGRGVGRYEVVKGCRVLVSRASSFRMSLRDPITTGGGLQIVVARPEECLKLVD